MTAIIKGRGITGFVDTTGLFSKGHLVHDWHAKIGREVVVAAKIEAPVRSGRLKASIYSKGPDRRAPKFLEVVVGARARYSRFVHGGTTGPIYARNGKYLRISTTPNGITGYSEPNDPFVSSDFGGAQVGKRFSGATTAIRFPSIIRSPPGVAGQDANPFLLRAMNTVGTKHRWRAGRARISRR